MKKTETVRNRAEHAAASLLACVLARQRRWADRLQQYSRHWSYRRRLIYLAIFIAVGSAINILPWFIHTSVLHTQQITAPGYAFKKENSHYTSRVDSATMAHIRAFKTYTDSLQQSPEGRSQYNRLLRERPGLIDSMNRIIQYMK